MLNRSSISLVIVFAVAVLFISVPAKAQEVLEVAVVDSQDSTAVPGVTVLLENPSIGFNDTKITNEQGKARFSGLSTSGAYRVSVEESQQYFEVKSQDILLRSKVKSSVTIALVKKAQSPPEEITVLGNSTTRINTINAEVSSSLELNDVQSLPIEGRDITRSLYRLPNVTQATGFYPEAPNVSINGANSLYTNYLIDGLDNNENFLGGEKFAIPVGATQNVTVLTNNFSTEYGLTDNGVINITTRSGSNLLHGEGTYQVRPGPALDSDSAFPQRDLSGNQVKEGFQRHLLGFSMGGPIERDKTFFYLDAEQTFDNKDNFLVVPELNVNETVPGQNRFTYLTGKIDQTWNSSLHSSLRLNSGLVNIQQQGGGLSGGVTFPSAGYSQDRNSILAASKNSYVSEHLFAETNLQYSRFRWNYGRPANPNSPQVTVLDPSEQTIAVLGNPGFAFNELENTWQFEQKINYSLKNHTLGFGGGSSVPIIPFLAEEMKTATTS